MILLYLALIELLSNVRLYIYNTKSVNMCPLMIIMFLPTLIRFDTPRNNKCFGLLQRTPCVLIHDIFYLDNTSCHGPFFGFSLFLLVLCFFKCRFDPPQHRLEMSKVFSSLLEQCWYYDVFANVDDCRIFSLIMLSCWSCFVVDFLKWPSCTTRSFEGSPYKILSHAVKQDCVIVYMGRLWLEGMALELSTTTYHVMKILKIAVAVDSVPCMFTYVERRRYRPSIPQFKPPRFPIHRLHAWIVQDYFAWISVLRHGKTAHWQNVSSYRSYRWNRATHSAQVVQRRSTGVCSWKVVFIVCVKRKRYYFFIFVIRVGGGGATTVTGKRR